ncbi:MAG: hypothetical protein FJX72_07680 [Armatimonadetes bacterium]|nr:hypothetical protein [Armatimonadota bacterium]
MAFTMTLAFVREHDKQLFLERVVPRLRGHLTEAPPDETADAQGYQRIAIAVTSQSAAKEVCRQAFGFLAHLKNSRILFSWVGADGETCYGDLNAGEGRDEELLSLRVGAAAKTATGADKAPPRVATEAGAGSEADSATEPDEGGETGA